MILYIIVFDVNIKNIDMYILKNQYYNILIYDNKNSIIVIFDNDYIQKSLINHIFDNFVNDLHDNIKFLINKNIIINLYSKKLLFIGFYFINNDNLNYNIFEMKLNNNNDLDDIN